MQLSATVGLPPWSLCAWEGTGATRVCYRWSSLFGYTVMVFPQLSVPAKTAQRFGGAREPPAPDSGPSAAQVLSSRGGDRQWLLRQHLRPKGSPELRCSGTGEQCLCAVTGGLCARAEPRGGDGDAAPQRCCQSALPPAAAQQSASSPPSSEG